ncbi:hypothetical protein L210DRAFT_3561117 [Boletus edulis BED1]|uniref:Uncharacterized protein n=1 Tax=Boletus edulis BED1 TaxID=1328754 RepID=A0AAD4BIJ4_BOLED|nr:hypothetical protein L210DRAFT_3561117 [Boletus edulis BED1]
MPSCSAKSMYRLASKVGFDHLRDEACSHIRNNLTEHNILKELSCSIVSKYPQLLEMELDVLCSWRIASPPVVANFPALAQRLVHGELPHGADIIVGIYTRFLNECHPRALKPAPPVPTLVPTSSGLPELVIPDASASGASRAEAKRKTGSSHLDQQGTQLVSSPSGSVGSRFTPSVPPQAPDAGGKKKGAGKRKCKM